MFEKIEWIKKKGIWLIILVLTVTTAFVASFWLFMGVSLYMHPDPYSASLAPEFQVKKSSGFKLYAVL